MYERISSTFLRVFMRNERRRAGNEWNERLKFEENLLLLVLQATEQSVCRLWYAYACINSIPFTDFPRNIFSLTFCQQFDKNIKGVFSLLKIDIHNLVFNCMCSWKIYKFSHRSNQNRASNYIVWEFA